MPEFLVDSDGERFECESAKKYNFETIECATNNKPKTIEEISNIVYDKVKEILNKRI